MRFQRVLLVSIPYPQSHYKPGDTPETGLGYIAEALKRNGIKYEVFDMSLGYDFNSLRGKVKDYNPDLIGASIKSFRYKYSYYLLNRIKASFPHIRIVGGGAHFSVLKEKVLEECSAIDYGITKEGEDTIVELCQGIDLSKIKGLIYRGGGGIVYTGDREFNNELDLIPFPRYENFELDKYWYPVRYIVSSRGCPHSCVYCSVRIIVGRRWRARSAGNVFEEIKYWYNRGYKKFEFIDDNFTNSKRRVQEFCDLIRKSGMEGLEFNCPNGIRADRVDRELLSSMKEVGWKAVSYGVEVGNDRMLKLIKKGETMEEIERAIKDAIDVGLEVHLFFILGFPGQSESDIEDSFDLALRYPIRVANFYNLLPYPGTELFSIAQESEYLIIPPEFYLNEVTTRDNCPVLKTPEMSVKDRKRIFKRAKKVEWLVRKRYYVRRLERLGHKGKIVGYLYSKNVIPDRVFNLAKGLYKLVRK